MNKWCKYCKVNSDLNVNLRKENEQLQTKHEQIENKAQEIIADMDEANENEWREMVFEIELLAQKALGNK